MRASNRTTEPVSAVPPIERSADDGPAGEMAIGAPDATESSRTLADRPGGMLDLSVTHPVAEVVFRQRAQVGGRVRSIRIRPWGEVQTLEAVIADDTAAITVAFLGRRSIAGIVPGGSLTVEGMVGARNGKLVILNPAYDLRVVS